jgi:hypothetical protein
MKKIIIYTNVILVAILTIQTQLSAQCVQCSGGSASGNSASIIGINNTAIGEASFAGGINSEAPGWYSFAFGNTAKSTGHHSIAMGAQTTAVGSSSFALGKFCTAGSNSSFTIGAGMNSSILLNNTISSSLMIGFNSDRPTFFVSGSSGIGSTGKVGIGDVTNPQAKLHIKSDDGEAAEVFIEPHPTSTTASLWLGTTQYGVRKTASRLDFKTAPGGVYVFNDGNVGIGTISPTQKLQVIGNIMTSGFIMTGGAGAGKVLTSDASGNANWTDPAWVIENDNIHRLNGNVGIGTANPSQKLEVNGNLRTTGFMMSTGAGPGKVLTSDASGIATWANTQWTASGNNIYRSTGNVGIGTTWPLARLVVSHTASVNTKIAEFIDSENRKLFFVPKLSNSGYNPISSANDAGIFWSDGSASGGQNLNAGFVIAPHNGETTGISIDHQGNVGIGKKSSPLARLDVNGTVKASAIEAPSMSINTMTISTLTVTSKLWAAEIEVTNLAGWKDYVFDDDYPLMPLSQVEAFILENRHLPGIPSEKEVMASGFNIAEMNAMLLQKIEELTLYVIELEKEIQIKFQVNEQTW